MLPRPPLISRCHGCGRFFWVGRAEHVGDLDPSAGATQGRQRPGTPSEWQAAPQVQAPDEAGWFEAIADGLAQDRDDERELRVQAWWAGNEPHRRGVPWKPFSQRSQAASDNLRALQALCSPEEPTERLLKAEALRELERYEEARAVLAGEFPEKLRWVAELLRELAQQGVAEVRRLERKEPPVH